MAAPDRFQDLLASKLAGVQDRAPRRTSGPIRTRPFEPQITGQFGWAQAGRLMAHLYGSGSQTPHSQRRKAVCVLTPRQRDALSVLRQLGARLDDHFDPVQLRKAYREMARALHPDRHPGANAQHRQRLNARFSALCEAYRALRSGFAVNGA